MDALQFISKRASQFISDWHSRIYRHAPKLYKAGYHTKQVEGNQNSSWVLMDYNDIIVHIFSKEDRLFYDLERMWTDGKTIALEEL